MTQNINIFIHHRDIRLQDNTTLTYMSQNVDNIIPIFIFTPEQIEPDKNKYFSNNLVQFMCESLLELKKEYKKNNGTINFFKGDSMDV